MIISPLRESALGIGEWSYLALMRSVSALMKIKGRCGPIVRAIAWRIPWYVPTGNSLRRHEIRAGDGQREG
jgi:hypothetical protein